MVRWNAFAAIAVAVITLAVLVGAGLLFLLYVAGKSMAQMDRNPR